MHIEKVRILAEQECEPKRETCVDRSLLFKKCDYSGLHIVDSADDFDVTI